MVHHATGLMIATSVMLGVALYDVAIGIWMLTSPQPWDAHGPNTLWSRLNERFSTLDDEMQLVTMSALRRIGAFSLCIGLFSSFVAYRFRKDRSVLLQFMVLYMVAGLGFATTDNTFFGGTAYYWVKQAIGAAWMGGTVVLWLSK